MVDKVSNLKVKLCKTVRSRRCNSKQIQALQSELPCYGYYGPARDKAVIVCCITDAVFKPFRRAGRLLYLRKGGAGGRNSYFY